MYLKRILSQFRLCFFSFFWGGSDPSVEFSTLFFIFFHGFPNSLTLTLHKFQVCAWKPKSKVPMRWDCNYLKGVQKIFLLQCYTIDKIWIFTFTVWRDIVEIQFWIFVLKLPWDYFPVIWWQSIAFTVILGHLASTPEQSLRKLKLLCWAVSWHG